jgi:hypothetical protein
MPSKSQMYSCAVTIIALLIVFAFFYIIIKILIEKFSKTPRNEVPTNYMILVNDQFYLGRQSNTRMDTQLVNKTNPDVKSHPELFKWNLSDEVDYVVKNKKPVTISSGDNKLIVPDTKNTLEMGEMDSTVPSLFSIALPKAQTTPSSPHYNIFAAGFENGSKYFVTNLNNEYISFGKKEAAVSVKFEKV